MHQRLLFLFTILLLPGLAHAQTAQAFMLYLLRFLNQRLIPFILGLAFLFFIINAIRFFVIGGATEDGRENAKRLAIYGVMAFVFVVVFWGMVNLISSSIGLSSTTQPSTDYVGPGAPPPNAQNSNPSAPNSLCASGAMFDENGRRCPQSGGPITPSSNPPITPVFVPPINN